MMGMEKEVKVSEDLKDPEFKPSDCKSTKHNVGTLEENIDEVGDINP